MARTLAQRRAEEASARALAIENCTLSNEEAYAELIHRYNEFCAKANMGFDMGKAVKLTFIEAIREAGLGGEEGETAELLKETLIEVDKLWRAYEEEMIAYEKREALKQAVKAKREAKESAKEGIKMRGSGKVMKSQGVQSREETLAGVEKGRKREANSSEENNGKKMKGTVTPPHNSLIVKLEPRASLIVKLKIPALFTTKPPSSIVLATPLNHTFPPFPTLSSPRALKDFYNGIDIALDNVLEDHEADASLAFVDIINNLEESQPTFTKNEGYDYRVTRSKGGVYVFEMLRRFLEDKPGLATKEMCRVLREHCDSEVDRLEKEFEG